MTRRLVWTIAGVVAIIGFVAFGAGAFRSNLTPYVSFQQARATKDAVQVAGKLVPGSDSFEEASSRLMFSLQDDHGDVLRVAYKGLKPGNFHDATQVVAIGRFQGGVLEAEKLLVKCPSKYQGVEEKEYRSSSS
ncbi:MAG TPA: cytochrome c maturation protein CcmE [Thermoanaerobaculaceae bacterium]|nr:cytochrome c maturation protein CcmE [Thermoanaerobaculaceae bacterium]